MIKIDGVQINLGHFPDGTMLVKYEPRIEQLVRGAKIEWKYENDTELLGLIYLVKHLRAFGVDELYLHMPYIPNARQDRVKTYEDIFTLKYFAEIINSLKFDKVQVLDPHSTVAEALIDRLIVETPKYYILEVLERIAPNDHFKKNITMFYPDNGAAKRYSDLVTLPYAFGIKRRDWETGKILGLDVADYHDAIMGNDILIVDDICSRGGTFLHAAKKLKELGAKDIYLFVSHCENTILESELLTSGLIKKIYTSDSIFTKEHELIEVLK